MTNVNKKEIVQLIEQEKDKLGSYAEVAKKAHVSTATISQMRNENWELIKPELWQKVASNLGYQGKWNIVETVNYKMVFNTLNDAKNGSMFIAISHKAGSGKTACLKEFAEHNIQNHVFYIHAREWTGRDFLNELCQRLSIDKGKGYVKVDKLKEKVINFFLNRVGQRPLLIVDEADKLKPTAIRFFIDLYNDLEDKMGVVISGTENLEVTIKRGVRFNKMGYDEIDSRFGRNYIHLIGATKKDIQLICAANGITDSKKAIAVFEECEPISITVGNDHNRRQIKVVEDMRRVKRVIKRELLMQNVEL